MLVLDNLAAKYRKATAMVCGSQCRDRVVQRLHKDKEHMAHLRCSAIAKQGLHILHYSYVGYIVYMYTICPSGWYTISTYVCVHYTHAHAHPTCH